MRVRVELLGKIVKFLNNSTLTLFEARVIARQFDSDPNLGRKIIGGATSFDKRGACGYTTATSKTCRKEKR